MINFEISYDQKTNNLPVFIKWMDYLNWLLLVTEKFPKKVRFTLSDRINNLALGMIEELVEARYSKNKVPILGKANLRLEKIRVLMRICHEQKFLPHQSYQHSAYALNEVGKMMGGWIKQQQGIGGEVRK